MTGTLDSQGVHTRVALDAWGRSTYSSYPYTTTDTGTSFEYDAFGRVTRSTNADGSTATSTYRVPGRSDTSLDVQRAQPG